MTTATTFTIRDRVDALDWNALRDRLDAAGHAITQSRAHVLKRHPRAADRARGDLPRRRLSAHLLSGSP